MASEYVDELLRLILDEMPRATNADLAADGPVGDEEGKVWERIAAKAREIRAAQPEQGDVPERAPKRIERMVCPECGEFANQAIWGPECGRYDNHRRSEDGSPRAVKCVPVAYVLEQPEQGDDGRMLRYLRLVVTDLLSEIRDGAPVGDPHERWRQIERTWRAAEREEDQDGDR